MFGLRRHKALLAFCLFMLTALGVVYFNLRDRQQQPWTIGNDDEESAHANPEDELARRFQNPLQFSPQPREIDGDVLNLLDHTYYVIFTPASKLWETIPVQMQTTFKRFKHHGVFSNTGAVLGDLMVVDIVAQLSPETIRSSPELGNYQTRRLGNDQNLGMGPEIYPEDDLQDLVSLVRPKLLRQTNKNAPPETQWYVLADSSSYINPEALNAILKDVDVNAPTVYTWGSSIIWNKAAAEAVETRKYEHIEQKVTSGNISSTLATTANWCSSLAFFHDLKPWEIQTLYDWDLSRQSSTTYGDYYRDFILPFIRIERANWELNPSGARYDDNYSENLQPHTQKRHCKRLCEMDRACLAWQWREQKECWLETGESLRRGTAMNPDLAQWSDELGLVTSGYMVDRIRSIRNEQSCDPLTISPRPQSVPNDNELTQEGWYFTMKERATIDGSQVLQAMYAYEEELAQANDYP